MTSERLTAADLGDMTAALDQLNAARAVWEFVTHRLALRYGLGEGDEITAGGEIKRAEPREEGR